MRRLKSAQLLPQRCAQRCQVQRGILDGIAHSHPRPHIDILQTTADSGEFFREAEHPPVVGGEYIRLQFLAPQVHMNARDADIRAVIAAQKRKRLFLVNAEL